MTDQQLFIKIDAEIKDAIKQLDILLGQEKEKIRAMTTEFGISTIDELLKLIDDVEKEWEEVKKEWQTAFDDLKSAYDWESIV